MTYLSNKLRLLELSIHQDDLSILVNLCAAQARLRSSLGRQRSRNAAEIIVIGQVIGFQALRALFGRASPEPFLPGRGIFVGVVPFIPFLSRACGAERALGCTNLVAGSQSSQQGFEVEKRGFEGRSLAGACRTDVSRLLPWSDVGSSGPSARNWSDDDVGGTGTVAGEEGPPRLRAQISEEAARGDGRAQGGVHH